MEAPEKIYLQICGECKDNDCKNCKFEDLEENVTHCKDKIFDNDIEYTRTDAFIGKACVYLEQSVKIILCGDKKDTDKFIEDFKNYMKGE